MTSNRQEGEITIAVPKRKISAGIILALASYDLLLDGEYRLALRANRYRAQEGVDICIGVGGQYDPARNLFHPQGEEVLPKRVVHLLNGRRNNVVYFQHPLGPFCAVWAEIGYEICMKVVNELSEKHDIRNPARVALKVFRKIFRRGIAIDLRYRKEINKQQYKFTLLGKNLSKKMNSEVHYLTLGGIIELMDLRGPFDESHPQVLKSNIQYTTSFAKFVLKRMVIWHIAGNSGEDNRSARKKQARKATSTGVLFQRRVLAGTSDSCLLPDPKPSDADTFLSWPKTRFAPFASAGCVYKTNSDELIRRAIKTSELRSRFAGIAGIIRADIEKIKAEADELGIPTGKIEEVVGPLSLPSFSEVFQIPALRRAIETRIIKGLDLFQLIRMGKGKMKGGFTYNGQHIPITPIGYLEKVLSPIAPFEGEAQLENLEEMLGSWIEHVFLCGVKLEFSMFLGRQRTRAAYDVQAAIATMIRDEYKLNNEPEAKKARRYATYLEHALNLRGSAAHFGKGVRGKAPYKYRIQCVWGYSPLNNEYFVSWIQPQGERCSRLEFPQYLYGKSGGNLCFALNKGNELVRKIETLGKMYT